METKVTEYAYDAYKKIMQIIDKLSSVGLLVEESGRNNDDIGSLLYGTADNLVDIIAIEHPELTDEDLINFINTTIQKSTNERVLYEVDDCNGETFYICPPAGVEKDFASWLESVMAKGTTWACTPTQSITNGFSYRLAMYPNTDREFDIYLPVNFAGHTDDAIYEWVQDYFCDTNYMIV